MTMNVRAYDMSSRQVAKEATREAILTACIETVTAERTLAVTLAAIADRADVTVKTVLRHFGSRDALIDAAWSKSYDEVMAERQVPSSAPETALKILIAHYERRGDLVLAILAADDGDPRVARTADWGRHAHRVWVEQVFDTQLPQAPVPRTRLIDTLVVATDMYSWKLLRRDRGLSVEQVHDRMHLMTSALLATS